MKKFLMTAGLIGLMFANNPVHAAAVSTQDFVRKASIASEFEIESSKLALEKSQDKDIKNFAQQMIDDHTKASENLKDSLKSAKTNAQPADELDNKHQELMDSLEALSGDNFDQRYIKLQTTAHKEAVDLFSSYSKQGKDASVKEFASNTLPTLKQHLSHVKQIQKEQ